MTQRALIVGGGIAGLSLAWWLNQVGVEPVVIERVGCSAPVGHLIALTKSGAEVVRQMGLDGVCGEFDAARGRYLLCSRADLMAALVEAVRGVAPIRHATEPLALNDQGDRIDVELSTGAIESYDFVFGADGLRSRTRRLVFGDGGVHPLGGAFVAFTVRVAHGLRTNQVRSYFGHGQSAHLFALTADEVTAVVYHEDADRVRASCQPAAVQAFLLDAFRGFAGELVDVFRAIDTSAFIFSEALAEVRMPSIVRGRVALLGDAAHCAAFVPGMGSSIALQAARTLAVHLQAPDRLAGALDKYDLAIRGTALEYQATARRMHSLLFKRRRWMDVARDVARRRQSVWAAHE